MRNNYATATMLVCMCFCISLQAQKIYFVKEGGKGDGSSWHTSSGDLASILSRATYGDQIWVAKGTYKPTKDAFRKAAFEVVDGVQLLGGFDGSEASAKDRKPATNKTILSGEIGKPGLDDNSYNVVYTKGVTEKTIVDGFIITAGCANGVGPNADRQRCGGGWYNDGSKGTSNPTILNCVFIENEARDGGALYNNGRAGIASPSLLNCTFSKNKADLDGGAIYNDGRGSGESSPSLTNCVFNENYANYGGALFNYGGGGGKSNPILFGCTITRNLAYVRGGAMLNMDVGGESMPKLESTLVDQNEASVGENVYQFSSINGSGIKSLTPRRSNSQ